ncbi:MAG: helix-turn-helix transcriptional regulator [Paludibacteraceae bacterium]|jgi:transcriptional regulator with XRE-family HTH domain|nr:helix-turn-helix transcriptional regulator [Paludibacteraceae bacterium]HHT61117.1 helix-turn-helix transcriptional regulator [Bacteroidales bacterium]MBP9039732.1 helix-turn-helix transcriptional regulator [Paludibacteraceae bacterium]HOA46345.1 helix-turn-helix transcriptional regulator [Paludibacteraceae bacterium]HOO23481.1 helix-turn-helix transcriptional regulator [Paludibacteraceae bacterium]
MTDSEKIVKLLERENLTAKQCADIIGITRSSMSHIINGRNNPSLDVMRKILENFPNINPEWLILGKGEMYRQKSNPREPGLFDNIIETNSLSDGNNEKQPQKATDENISTVNSDRETISVGYQNIKSIIVFFSDNTYEEFKHSN